MSLIPKNPHPSNPSDDSDDPQPERITKSLRMLAAQRYAKSAMKLFLDFIFSRPAILLAVCGVVWHLSSQLSSIEGRLDVLENKIQPLGELQVRVSKNTELLMQISGRLGRIDQRISRLEQDVSELKQRLNSVDIQVKANTRLLGSLDVQVKANTRLLGSLDQRVLQLNQELGNIRVRVSSLEVKSVTLGKNVEVYGERLRRIERLLGEMKSLGTVARLN